MHDNFRWNHLAIRAYNKNSFRKLLVRLCAHNRSMENRVNVVVYDDRTTEMFYTRSRVTCSSHRRVRRFAEPWFAVVAAVPSYATEDRPYCLDPEYPSQHVCLTLRNVFPLNAKPTPHFSLGRSALRDGNSIYVSYVDGFRVRKCAGFSFFESHLQVLFGEFRRYL